MMVIGNIYVRVLGITWMLHILLIVGSRFSWRVYRDRYMKPLTKGKRTLIVGAGSAGSMVTRQLINNHEAEFFPVAFVDDDNRKLRLQIYGVPVLGETANIAQIVENKQIEHIIIAIPSLKRSEVKRIFEECSKTKAETKIIPMLEDLASGKVSVNHIRDVQVEDLLGREPVELDMETISGYVTDKTILVTGAGGSIGSEICRQICQFQPKKLFFLVMEKTAFI
jgi:FlaA1/EpsC-like NDP-sugar epimerase